jgi:hypothetical protein
VTFDPHDVIQACSNFLEHKKKYVEEQMEKHIQNEMKPIKIFGYSILGKTRDEALKIVSENPFSDYNMEWVKASYDSFAVYNLMIHCNKFLHHPYVELTDDEFDLICDFFTISELTYE